jgi:hypothetical protein
VLQPPDSEVRFGDGLNIVHNHLQTQLAMIFSFPRTLVVTAVIAGLASGQVAAPAAAVPAAAAPVAAVPAAAAPVAAAPAAANPAPVAAAAPAAGAAAPAAAAGGGVPVANTPLPNTADGKELVGTWSSKSKKVHTGPVRDAKIPMGITALDTAANSKQGFYNPVKDNLIEPDLPGISYSFTADGWYEEAYYRVEPNRMCILSYAWVVF